MSTQYADVSSPLSIADVTFAEPVWLLVGIAACALLAVGVWIASRARRRSLAFLAAPSLRDQLVRSRSLPRIWTRRVALVLGTALLFVALARPRWGTRWETTTKRGVDVVFAVDTSKSMLAEDARPNRLEQAKLVVRDLSEAWADDRVGLVAFAGTSFLQTPLTLDRGALDRSLDALDASVIPNGGTNIASAIDQARRALEIGATSDKVIVLVTDGEALGGDALEAAERAAEAGVRILTVGVGTPNGELIPTSNERGEVAALRGPDGAVVRSRLDEALLREVAEASGGKYFGLDGDAQRAVAAIAAEVEPLAGERHAERTHPVPIERYPWPLGAALILLALEPLIGEARRRRARRSESANAKRQRLRPVLAAGALVASMGAMAAPAYAADARVDYNEGVRAYRDGSYEDATRAFQTALKTPDVRLQQRSFYDLGNAHYRVGESSLGKDDGRVIEVWEDAIEAYDAALALDGADEDARYNRDLVQQKLNVLQQQKEREEEKKRDPQQQEQQDQQQQDQQQGGQQQEDQQQQTGGQQQHDQQQQQQQQQQGGEQQEDQQQSGKQQEDHDARERDSKQQGDRQQQGKGPGDDGDTSQSSGDRDPSDAHLGDDEAEPRRDRLDAAEAAALLESLSGDLRTLAPGAGGDPRGNDSIQGKDW